MVFIQILRKSCHIDGGLLVGSVRDIPFPSTDLTSTRSLLCLRICKFTHVELKMHILSTMGLGKLLRRPWIKKRPRSVNAYAMLSEWWMNTAARWMWTNCDTGYISYFCREWCRRCDFHRLLMKWHCIGNVGWGRGWWNDSIWMGLRPRSAVNGMSSSATGPRLVEPRNCSGLYWVNDFVWRQESMQQSSDCMSSK